MSQQPHSPSPARAAAPLRLPWAIFALLAGIYLLTTGGHTYASDEEALLTMAASLLDYGSFAVNAGSAEAPRFVQYGPGQPIMAAPLLLAGRAVAAAFPPEGAALILRMAIAWFNPLVTAGSAALIVVAAMRLGYSVRAAAATALLFGLATMAWPHSKTFFSEPLGAALSFAGFALALPRQPGRTLASPPALFGAGLLAGLACLMKIQAGLYLPLLGLWVLAEGGRAGGRWSAGQSIRAAAVWSAGALLGLAPLGLYQWLAFGSPLQSGYGGGIFTFPLLDGLYGLLLSSGKSLFLYAPPLLLLPAGLWLLARRHRSAALLCAGVAVATLALYAVVNVWHGDGAWGPRYLNSALPFLAFPLVAVCAQAEAARPWRIALLATLILTLPVQFGGLAINLNAYLGVQRDAERRYFEPSQSPVLGHLRLAAAQLATSYQLRLDPGVLVLADGFSYSEGDRAAGTQLPRWTLPAARIALRPPVGAARVRVDLALSGCLPAPLAFATVRIGLDGARIGEGPACPPRRYTMLLPSAPAAIGLETAGWRPAEVGIDREGELGVLLSNARAWADGTPLTVAGRLVPIPPAPATPVALRLWSSDYRYGHWDFWPWYLAHSGLPGGPSVALALVWFATAGTLIALGLGSLRQHLTDTNRHDTDKRQC